jgi:dTMP kinase
MYNDFDIVDDYHGNIYRGKLYNMFNNKVKLIAIEGIDGVGKTTQSNMLAKYLKAMGSKVRLLKEPSDSKYGKQIRQLAQDNRRLDPKEEYRLFIFDRKENLKNNIIPALNRQEIVILDRYYFSTAAYQGVLGIDPNAILKENEGFAPIPNIVILLDLPVDEALKRITENRGDKANAFETVEYLTKVKAIFDTFNYPFLFRVDSSKPVDNVHKTITNIVDNYATLDQAI